MTELDDPSRARDAAAAFTATQRCENSILQGRELSDMVSQMKIELSANTASTREIADRQLATSAVIRGMESEIQKVDFGKLAEMVDAIDTMKGGVKVLGWLERPAKWFAAIAGAIAAAWAMYHAWGAK